MIGSVSSGFRRRRRRNASRVTVATTARPAGSRQLPPADPGDVRGILAGRAPTVCRFDGCACIARPSKLSRAEAPTRCNSTLASGVAVVTLSAREPSRTSTGSAGVTDSGVATSEAPGEVSDRIVGAWPLEILGSIAAAAGGDTAGLSGVLRRESLLGSLAGVGLAVDSGAVSEVSRAGFASACTAGAASVKGAVAAESPRPATRAGSKVSGSTYPCGSLVMRVPK